MGSAPAVLVVRGGGGGDVRVTNLSLRERLLFGLLCLLLASHGFHLDGPLLVLAPLVLEPDSNHSRTEGRQLHQVLLQ